MFRDELFAPNCLTRKAFNHSAVRVVEHHGVQEETKRDSCKPRVNCGKPWNKLFEGAKLGDMGDEECFWKRLFVDICCLKTVECCLHTKFRVTSKRCGERAVSAEVQEAFWNRLCASSGHCL